MERMISVLRNSLTKVVNFCSVGMVVLLILSLTPQVQAQSSLVGHWTFDEGLQSNAAGKIGKAARFSGEGSISLSEQAAVLGKLTDLTLSMWVQYDGGPSRVLFSFSDGTLSHRIQMEIQNGELGFGLQNGGGWQDFRTKPLHWEAGKWYHVVFVCDSKLGKSILRSNDLVWIANADTLTPAGFRSPVTHIEIGSLNGGNSFNGCIDDVRLYDSALPISEQLAIYENDTDKLEDTWVSAMNEFGEKYSRIDASRSASKWFHTDMAPDLSKSELQQKTEWLFQAENDDLFTRTDKEIGWTGEMIDRLQKRSDAPNLKSESAVLKKIQQQASVADSSLDASKILKMYFDIRALKRRVMLKYPEIDFADIICVDAPYTHRSLETHGTFQQTEWVHESRFRSEMCATTGAKLLVLEDFAKTPQPRQLAPDNNLGQPAAMMSFDLSFDGDKVLFCMLPEDEKAYHVYEMGLDGSNFRQVTSGGYSDIDPIYLPGDRYLFLSTRADVYAQCGMWARSYIMTRCDSNGKNISILTPGTEPDYSPSLLDDGRILSTRWEYVDKSPQNIQSLWTMRPDGTGMATYYGNQTVRPDHFGEARQIPGTSKVMFNAFGHHDVWVGCVGIVDQKEGLNFPDGIWKVTQEMHWPEMGDGPVPTPGFTKQYHTSGRYAGYKTPYPLSDELFLVSARTGAIWVGGLRSGHDPSIGKFKLYLMDIYGNRELIYEGDNNMLYAQPVRSRKTPRHIPDIADMPGSEKDNPTIRPGIFYSNNIFENAPPEVREYGKYLRVVECMPKNYSVGLVHSGGKPFGTDGPNTAWGAWGEQFLKGKTPTPTTDLTWGDHSIVQGPVVSVTGPLTIKQVHGTVPIGEDGSVYFEVQPARMLYFQVLDEHYRAVHTMRSWVSARPGEIRGCTGCHEAQNSTPAATPLMVRRPPDKIQSPPWGVHSLSYVKHVQPIFDRNCANCHQGNGQAVDKLNLTLRPDESPERAHTGGVQRFGGIFPEPYLTLTLGKNNHHLGSWPKSHVEDNYVGVRGTIDIRYDTLPPLSCMSPKSRLITQAMDKNRCGKNISADDLRMLIAWVDLWAMFRSDEEVREIEDAPSDWFPLWTYPPKTKTAPFVRTEYSQDEYTRPQDRL